MMRTISEQALDWTCGLIVVEQIRVLIRERTWNWASSLIWLELGPEESGQAMPDFYIALVRIMLGIDWKRPIRPIPEQPYNEGVAQPLEPKKNKQPKPRKDDDAPPPADPSPRKKKTGDNEQSSDQDWFHSHDLPGSEHIEIRPTHSAGWKGWEAFEKEMLAALPDEDDGKAKRVKDRAERAERRARRF